MNLTAIIPTLNEEDNIRAAIESVSFANEIIVIDSLSTDRTIEIAKELNCKILLHEFDNFSAQKNRAIEQASFNWILILDADERISPELRDEIIQLLETEPKHAAFRVFRRNFFMGKEIRFSGWQNDKVIRLFRKDKCQYNNKPVHEEIETNENLGFLKNKLIHNTYKNFDGYLGKLNHYAWLQAEEYNKKVGKISLYHLALKPAFRFFRHFVLKQGFRDGFAGFVIAYLQAFAVFSRYAKIRLLRKEIN